MNRLYLGGAIIAAAAFVCAAAIFFTSDRADVTAAFSDVAHAEDAATPASDEAVIAALKEKGYLLGDVEIGDAEAKVLIKEYASPTCPHCATFHDQILPDVKKDVVETGKARFVLREVIWDQLGLYAAALARCSGKEKAYHALTDIYFEKQSDWSLGGGQAQVAQGVQVLKRYGLLAGMNAERIDQCLTDQQFLEHLYKTSQANTTADEIQATPTIIVNGEKMRGVRDAKEIAEKVEAAL